MAISSITEIFSPKSLALTLALQISAIANAAPGPVPQAAAPPSAPSAAPTNPSEGSGNGGGVNGPVQDQNWRTLTCTAPAVTDATIDPTTRWNDLLCQDGWLAAVQDASTAPNIAQVSWPQLIANYFHATDNMECGSLSARNGCNSNIECQDQSKGSYVPAFEILNSFVGVSGVSILTFNLIRVILLLNGT